MFSVFKPRKQKRSGPRANLEKAMTRTSRMRFARQSRFSWRFILRWAVVVLGTAVLATGCWGLFR